MKKPIEKLTQMIMWYEGDPKDLKKINKYMTKKKISASKLSEHIEDTKDPYIITRLIKTGHCTIDQLRLDSELYEAVRQANAKEVKSLLKQGANPNRAFAYGSNEENVLYYATEQMQPEIIKILLAHGADPKNGVSTSYSHSYLTPLDEAATVAERNQRYDILMPYFEIGVNAKSYLKNNENGALFTASSTVEKLRSIYMQPLRFLDLPIDTLRGKNLVFYKQSAMYGLQREAKELKEKGKLTEEYIAESKGLISEISKMAKKAQEKDARAQQYQYKKLQKNLEKEEQNKAKQEELFEELCATTKALKPRKNSTEKTKE